jgi:uncharacterized protein (DUF1501 family)
MQRRNFLKISGLTPLVVNGFSMRPFANRRMARVLADCGDVEERVLILIQLKGGNDGLNTIIPIDQYDVYANLRPTIRIPQNAYVNLDSTLPQADQVALHPALLPVKQLYEDGRATLVQAVGYQLMNQSHFQGTDLWWSGGDGTPANNNIGSGWMGRALQGFFPDVTGAPTADMPDPLGIQVGDPSPALGFHTETEHQNAINLSGQDPAGFYSLVQTIGGAPLTAVPASEYGGELDFIMGVEQSVNLYAQRISAVFNAGSNSPTVTYPEDRFANQLRTIARLIKGGCKTKIYTCQIGGFDTHSGQVGTDDVTTGEHAELLTSLARGIEAFLNDLEALGLADQVVACTFSEFGRCAAENGSSGTDHGTLAPMLLFGKNVKPGVNGTNVNLSNLTNDNQLQGMQFDYRQVFTSLLQDWLGASGAILEQTMFDGYAKVPLLDPAAVVEPDCYYGSGMSGVDNPATRVRALTLFPNPAQLHVEVTYTSTHSFDVYLTLHSLGGSLISGKATIVRPGVNLFYLDVSSLPAGTYFVRLEGKGGGPAEVAKLQVAR